MSDEIKHQIFQLYSFRNSINIKTSPKILVREIYNAYFKRKVIDSSKDKCGKHLILSIDETTRDMFDLGFNYLERFNRPENTTVDLFVDEYEYDATIPESDDGYQDHEYNEYYCKDPIFQDPKQGKD